MDQAVWSFGTALDAALEDATSNPKMKTQQRERARAKVLNQWLPGTQGGPGKYRDVGKEAPDGMARRT